ncbi:MAG: hypothetical protein CDV28_12432 [Candidatus Electronema aureum]|uniref:Uncharacterized protein n=1 Tax=Candidatus Electronema aureum TaxID=2005002 RepID=A0A521G0L4_9BACT|nr:MAG: hypothetical protein CDV28_12432 [Candidatus Electronema aureum]
MVGCRDLQVFETGAHALINGFRISFGDPVSIDERSGLFLRGMHPTREEGAYTAVVSKKHLDSHAV